MDEIINGITNPQNPAEHAKILRFYEELKSSDLGWKVCLETIVTGRVAGSSEVQFFNLQVIEHHVRERYNSISLEDKEVLRNFMRDWVKFQELPGGRLQEVYILNKAAQITALAFIQDFPNGWPEFFTEFIAICEVSPNYLNHFLRVLLAIDGEIADRDMPRANLEIQRNNLIKDAMRKKAVVQLVESWYKILTVLNGQYTLIIRLCLQAIGKYIQWIDINLVANDRFVPVFVSNLLNPDIREAAADCIHEVISKGMDPIDKTKLVESFSRVLADAGIWHAFTHDPDEDYLCKLGKLYCVIGTSLIESYHKFSKSHPGQQAEAQVMREALEVKIPLLIQILGNECDDVSATVLDFTRDYLHLIKSYVELTELCIKNYRLTVDVVIRKLKYDSSYNFEHEGEDEATFMDYRKQLKVIFDNLAQLDKNYIISEVQNRVTYATQKWREMPYEEVEVTLLLLYYLGESLPSSMTSHWNAENQQNPLETMMIQLMNSDIFLYDHGAVTLQFFETIIRYEKFFIGHPDYIVKGLTAFLKEKGLFHADKKIRSRCCYLFSRYIKCIRCRVTPDLMKTIIGVLQPLLALNIVRAVSGEPLITRDDQLYLYEVIGVLIVSGETENQKKVSMMNDIIMMIIYPCRVGIERLKTDLKDDFRRQESMVEMLVQAVALIGRLSKAFSTQITMKSIGCVAIFLEALGVFLEMLDVPVPDIYMAQLQSAVRQYLHRMVVCCNEEELLPFIPIASQGLLKNCDSRSIQEYIPLINQVITKFKKDVVPFLKQMFTPMVQGVFRALQIPVEPNDQIALRERQLLRRQYFNFIATIVTNNVIDVLAAQDMNVIHEVMMTIIHGSVEFPDPVAQKSCFSILKKLVDVWAGPEGPEGFMDFMYKNIVPACFAAPLKPSFDINDAQTLIALNEIANCLKAVFDRRKEEFVSYLVGYLPTQKIPLDKTQEFISALQSDAKHFRGYLKTFFMAMKPTGS